MNRNADLIGYLPPFMARCKEIKRIMTAENPEFDLLASAGAQAKNNLFINYCDESGIRRFEKILGIVPSELDTLESRKSRVLIRWNDMTPYTYEVLLSKLDAICGAGNYDIDLNVDEYWLHLVTHLEMYGQTDELQYLLRNIVPANIALNLKNDVYCDASGDIYIGGAACGTDAALATNDFDEGVVIGGSMAFGAGISCGETVTAVNDFDENAVISGFAAFGARISCGETVTAV